MKIKVYDNKVRMSEKAAEHAAASIASAIAARGKARIIVATGASMFDFLRTLSQAKSVDWSKVEMFHLDEYIGLPIDHPASFRGYLMERIIKPAGITNYHLLDGEGDVQAACKRTGTEIRKEPVDVAFVGIGENGHLAFNDPPADFETKEPYIIVELDEACRKQQLGEGWFPTLADVPQQAISMSIHQIMQSNEIICIVPEGRKAPAVRMCLEGEITPMAPASILREHGNTTVYLDAASSAQLEKTVFD